VQSGPSSHRAAGLWLATGGEGRNFQFADAVVHYHQSRQPARVEQRTGRLDRIRRTRYRKVVLSLVICAAATIEEALGLPRIGRLRSYPDAESRSVTLKTTACVCNCDATYPSTGRVVSCSNLAAINLPWFLADDYRRCELVCNVRVGRRQLGHFPGTRHGRDHRRRQGRRAKRISARKRSHPSRLGAGIVLIVLPSAS